MGFVNLGVAIYVIGLAFWFLVWHWVIGYDWLKKEPAMHVALWGGAATLVINAVLTAIAQVPEYGVEIGIYPSLRIMQRPSPASPSVSLYSLW